MTLLWGLCYVSMSIRCPLQAAYNNKCLATVNMFIYSKQTGKSWNCSHERAIQHCGRHPSHRLAGNVIHISTRARKEVLSWVPAALVQPFQQGWPAWGHAYWLTWDLAVNEKLPGTQHTVKHGSASLVLFLCSFFAAPFWQFKLLSVSYFIARIHRKKKKKKLKVLAV